MTSVLFCAAVSLAIFALAALADERWPERLDRRGQKLLGKRWDGRWGVAPPAYPKRARKELPSLAPAPR